MIFSPGGYRHIFHPYSPYCQYAYRRKWPGTNPTDRQYSHWSNTTVFTILALGLYFFSSNGRRRNRTAFSTPSQVPVSKEQHSPHRGRLEIEGDVPLRIVEGGLDAHAVRGNLEETLGKDDEAAIYVMQLELADTPGKPGWTGPVYMKRSLS